MTGSPTDTELEVRQLRDRIRLLEGLLRHSTNLLFSLDEQGRILSVNEAAERALGYSEQELAGRPFDELIAPASLQNATEFNAEFRTRDGKPLAVEIRKERRIVIALDLHERQALEEGALQAQRMETLGLLAAGIAHDFNSLLTGILGYAHLLQTDPETPKQHGEALEVIVKSSERAAELTSQLLGLARGKKSCPTRIDLHYIIHDIVELLRRTIDKKVSIRAETSAADYHLVGDASQMYQVLLNLALNARDAMPSGGEIVIRTKNSGDGLVVSVSDTGVGMPLEVRGHIFEAFFTTKRSERGSGMGLATVKAIVRNHGGVIDVKSEVGVGTVFHITLPVIPVEEGLPACDYPSLSGEGTILVIEGDPFVRQVLDHMLSEFGHAVVCTDDLNAGTAYFREHRSTIEAVILDLGMPASNGIECLETLKAIDPNIRAVLTSGSGNGDVPGVEYLAKPYQPEHLAEVLRRTLHQPVSRAASAP